MPTILITKPNQMKQFFHHPLHPMGFQERLVILFGSIAIGLTISNFTYLWFIRNGISVEEEVFVRICNLLLC